MFTLNCKLYCIENYSITSGETTNRARSGCVQNYQYLENTYVIKIQSNIEILKENYYLCQLYIYTALAPLSATFQLYHGDQF
jgi:hypothetical protein